MGKRRQVWSVGDVFLVELQDGTSVVGQIVGQEKQALNSVSCAFFDLRVRSEAEVGELPLSAIFSILFVTRESLDRGIWRVIGNRPVTLPTDRLPYESCRSTGFVGAKIRGSGIVEKFLNAFYGLLPWDDWYDPVYLDGFLTSPDKKPRNLIFKAVSGKG